MGHERSATRGARAILVADFVAPGLADDGDEGDAGIVPGGAGASGLVHFEAPDVHDGALVPGAVVPIQVRYFGVPTPEAYVREVQSEKRDEAWAAPTARQLEEDLRDKGERLGFRVRSVDCRSARCFAELDYESLHAARAGFKQAFDAPDHLNCPIRLFFPTEGSDSAPVLGTMIVDCRGRNGRGEGTASPEANP